MTRNTKVQQLYSTISRDSKYESIRWIAGVLFTNGKPATRLSALKALVDSGREVRAAQFIMPYEALVVDGRFVVAMPLLDRGQEIPYTSDWYKA